MAQNKMKKIKLFISIILTVALVTPLSACRKKGEEEEGGAQPISGETIEIVWWNLFDPCDTFKGQIQEFQSQNPGYKITCKKFTNADEFEKLLINELAEGEGPDIFSIKNTKVKEHQKKISPVPANLIVPEEFRDLFFSVASDDLILEDEDGLEQIYGIPLYIDTLAIYYNKQLFRDNIPSTDKPADNWEDLKEQVYALTKSDNSIERFAVSGIAMGRADNISRSIDILSLLLIQHDTELYSEDGKRAKFAEQQGTIEGTGKPYYRGVEALKLYTSFALSSYKNYSWNNLITSFFKDEKEVGVFVKGKTAMIFGYSWLYDEIDLQIQAAQKSGESHIALEDVGIAVVPQLVDPERSGKRDAFASYYPLTVSRNSEHADIAWEFISFLASPESLQDYHEQTHKPTSRMDMVDDQSVESLFGVFARQASYAKSLQPIDEKTFNTIFSEAIDSVAKSKSTSESALQLAQKRMDCVIKKKSDPLIDTVCEEIE